MFSIRDANESDIGFIYATWLKGQYYGSSYFNACDKKSFFKNYQREIDVILTTPGVKCSICVLSSDPDVILGYSVFSSKTLYWTYVKEAWRRQGLASKLVPNRLLCAKNSTIMGDLVRAKIGMSFDPWSST